MIAIIAVLAFAATAVSQRPGPPPPGGGGGAGGGAPSVPEGATECKVDGSSASFEQDVTSDADYVLVTSNGCPVHKFINAVGNNPNKAYTQTLSLKLPKVPVLRSNASGYNTAIDTQLGTVGIAVSNVALFGPAVSPTGGDAGVAELDTFDCGQGHSSPDGFFHFHIAPYLVDRAQPAVGSGQHSPLYGFLVDGFPVYGPYGDDGAAPGDLDACGGHSGDAGGLGYHYHTNAPDGVVPGPGSEATTLNAKPYFAACLRGCVPDGVNGAQPETYADCVAASAPAPVASVPTYASDNLALVAAAAYNYSGCPAGFSEELEREEGEQNAATGAAVASAGGVALLVVAAASAVALR